MGKADRYQLGSLISTRMVGIPGAGRMPHGTDGARGVNIVSGSTHNVNYFLDQLLNFSCIYWDKFVTVYLMFTCHGHYE